MVKQGDEVLAGNTKNTNTLQLGTPQSVTFPFTPTSDGIIVAFMEATNSAGGKNDYVNSRIKQDGLFCGGHITVGGMNGLGFLYQATVRKGIQAVLENTRCSFAGATFYPFVPTTGEPVDQTFDPTSVFPQSGVAVAEALSTLREGYTPIEIKVGETQSGKPVYRQSYVMNSLTFNDVGNVNISGYFHNLGEMESVERISGVLNRYQGSSSLFSQTVPNNSHTAIRFTRNGGSNSIILTATGWAIPSGYSLRDSFITLEYTKLTD